MCRNFWKQSSLSLVLVVALSSPAGAQEMERPGGPKPMPPVMEELDRMTGPERGPGGSPGGGEESGRHFEAKKRERLMQALHLDEATRSRLGQRLEQLDQKGEDLRRQRKEAFKALREQAQGPRKDTRRGPREDGGRKPEEAPPPAGPAVDSGVLKQALERVYAVEDAMAGLRRERTQAVRELLTPEQQAKFLLFSARFRKEMRERMLREGGGQEGGTSQRRR
jgi:Spy/CpxP family protein refolding chaperone